MILCSKYVWKWNLSGEEGKSQAWSDQHENTGPPMTEPVFVCWLGQTQPWAHSKPSIPRRVLRRGGCLGWETAVCDCRQIKKGRSGDSTSGGHSWSWFQFLELDECFKEWPLGERTCAAIDYQATDCMLLFPSFLTSNLMFPILLVPFNWIVISSCGR